MDNEEDFAENTKLCAAILTGPQGTEDGSEVCILPGGEEVNCYQVIPLYRDELEYKLAHDADALLDKMEGISFVVEPDRCLLYTSPSARSSPRSGWTSRTGTSARPWSIWSLHTPMAWRWTFTSPLMWSPTWPPSCWSAASAAV